MSNWYKAKSTQSLAYQLFKYKQRDGWSHRDVIRLAHVKETDEIRNSLIRKVINPDAELPNLPSPVLDFVKAADEVASVRLGHLVGADVRGPHTICCEGVDDALQLCVARALRWYRRGRGGGRGSVVRGSSLRHKVGHAVCLGMAAEA